MDAINTLPEEMLLKIFGYFDIQAVHTTIAKVCLRWEGLSSHCTLNGHITLKIEPEESDEEDEWCDEEDEESPSSPSPPSLPSPLAFLESLSTKSRNAIHSLRCEPHIFSDDDKFDQELARLSSLCPGITRLHISQRFRTKNIWPTIMNCFPALEYLNAFTEKTYPPQFIDTVRNHKCLVINNFLRRGMFHSLAEACKSLNELHVYFTSFFLPVIVAADELNYFLTMRSEHLTKLTLREIDSTTFDAIVNCTNLTELRLYGIDGGVTPSALSALSALGRLTVLHMTGLKTVSEIELNDFIDAHDMSRLIDLNLSASAFSNLSAKKLCRQKLRLRRLELGKCKKLTSPGILHIFRHLPSLLFLDVTRKIPFKVLDVAYKNGTIKYLRFLLWSNSLDYFRNTKKYLTKYKEIMRRIKIFQAPQPDELDDWEIRPNEGWSAAIEEHDARANFISLRKDERDYYISDDDRFYNDSDSDD